MKKQLNRFGITGLLFITGLFVASFVLLNVTDVVSRIQKEEAGFNKFAYNKTLLVRPAGVSNQEFASEVVPKILTATESANCNTIIRFPVNIEYRINTSDLNMIMNSPEDPKLVDTDNKPISTDYSANSNSIVIGESAVDFTENRAGKTLNINGNKFSVQAVLKNTYTMKTDTSLYAFWDSCDEEFRDYLIEQRSSNFGRDGIMVCFLSDSPIADEMNRFSAAMKELGLKIEVYAPAYNGSDGANMWYRVFNQMLLPVCIIFSVFVCFSSSFFWVMSRKNEISIRKAYGYSNSQILGLIIKDELHMTLPAIAAAIIVQFVFCAILGTLDFFDALFPVKLLAVCAGMLLMTLLCAARLTNSIGNISPAAALKEV